MISTDKRVIVVLGMHRSGTSAITRALNVVGVELGDRLLAPVPGDNAKGYFEDIDLNALNIEMLDALGTDWHSLAPIEADDVDTLRKKGFFLRAATLLRQKSADFSVYGFKDPRVAKLLPFWHQVFEHCKFDTGYVLAIRNPLSVARSLEKRAAFTHEKSYMLWLEHTLNSLLYTEKRKAVLVDYDHFLHAPQISLELIAERLDLQVDANAMRQYQSEFLDEGLRHTVYDVNDLRLDENCPPLVQELYAELIAVSRDNTQLNDPEFHARTALRCDEFKRLNSNLRWIDNLSAQIENLNQTIAAHDEKSKGLVKAALEQDRNVFENAFNSEWYLKKYPDIAAAGVDAYQHYISDGVSEGRLPSPDLTTFIRDAWLDRSKEFNDRIDRAWSLAESHLLQLAESETAFSQRLQQIEQVHAHEKGEQSREYAEREQVYLAQLTQARQQIETQLLELAEREKRFSTQLREIRHVHEQQKDEQRREHIAREQAHLARLTQAQQQIETLLLQLAERERALSAKLQEMQKVHDEERGQQSRGYAEREQVYLAQLTQARQQIETQLLELAERERSSFTQLREIQHVHEQQKDQQRREHTAREEVHLAQAQQQIETLLRQLAEGENALSAKLREMQQVHDQQRGAESREYAEREQVHLAQLTQARQQIETQLLELAEREKGFSTQLREIQHAHDQQKDHQSREYTAREQAHLAQLTLAQQHIETLLLQLAERERVLSAKLQEMELVHDQQRGEESRDYAVREQVHLAQLTQARQQIETQLLELAEREKRFSTQLREIRQVHEQQKDEQRREYTAREQAHLAGLTQAQQQIETLLLQLAERERTLSAKLREMRQVHDQERGQQSREYAERERVYLAQLTQARQQTEKQLLELAERERASFNQLREIQHVHEQQKDQQSREYTEREEAHLARAQQQIETLLLQLAERGRALSAKLQGMQQVHDQQSGEQSREYAGREQALNAQLHAKQDELHRLTYRFVETEKAQVVAVDQLRRELDAIRNTYSWRWTSPLRSLAGVLVQKNLRSSKTAAPAAGEVPANDRVTTWAAQTTEMPSALSLPPINIDNRTFDMTLSCTSLDELLSHHDERFVHSSYYTLLGRAPDPEGMRYYVARLRDGISKVEILAQLSLGGEGKARKVNITGLNAATRYYRLLKSPILGPLLRLMTIKAQERRNTQQKLAAIDNKLNAISVQMQQSFLDINRLIDARLKSLKTNIRGEVGPNLDAAVGFQPEVEAEAADAALLFDTNWYLEQNPDVAAAGMNAYQHYIAHGKFEGRHPGFDKNWYLQEYPDVAAAGIDPYEHYIHHGKLEGRHPSLNRHWYLQEYSDVAEFGHDPYQHYIDHGKSEGRHPAFDRHQYLIKYSDVAGAGIDPYKHYFYHGKAEGRHPAFFFGHSSKLNSFAGYESLPFAIGLRDDGGYEISENVEEYTYIPVQRPINLAESIEGLAEKLKFSIVVPIYNTPPTLLAAMLRSVQAQWYPNWELILIDDASTHSETQQNLAGINDIKIVVTRLDKNQGIAGATNAGIAVAKGDFIVFLDHDDELTDDCLYELALCINRDKSDYVYSDEDKLTPDGKFTQPHYKPSWSPDTMMSTMYTSHVSAIRRMLLKHVGGLRSEYDGCQDWDLILRVTESTNRISHIPKVLYHWRIIPGSIATDIAAKSYVLDATKKVRLDALKRRGLSGKLEPVTQVPGYFRINYHLTGNPLISIIIPTRDNLSVLRRCIDSIVDKSTYRNFELIIVDNGSVNTEVLGYLHKIHLSGVGKVVRHDAPFNYSDLNNIGTNNSKGELLLFLNDDTEVVTRDWLERLGGYAQLSHIGAVGAKLLYPGNDLIQHSGILNLEHGPGHALLKSGKDTHGYFMRGLLEYNWLAVTGACLMISREKFDLVKGFNTTLPVAYNDVELCMKAYDAGLYNIVCQAVHLIHHESASRGLDDMDPEKMKRLKGDLRHLYKLHPKYFQYDPFHNPNLHPNGINFERLV
jgi:glycosyltransferase involved in cell wall biosynthesis